MATYTDNYQLTKPTYAEQADIGVINSNMNIIDDIMHSSQVSLAPAYDQSQTYAEGDVVMYELLMYKCISPTTGVWDGSKWERTTASESGGGGSAELDILGEASGAVASFADGASAGLAKCIAEIVPKQAGSGTPSPDNVRTISGSTSVTVTVSDGETSTTKTTALGQIVYGGQLNVLTGELTIDRQIVDLGSLTWTRTDNSIIDVGYWFHANVSGKIATGETINSNYRTAPYKSVTQLVNAEGSAVDKVAVEAGGEVGYRIIDSSYTDATAFKTAMNGVQMCYFLATPQTVQLTPQEVNSLLGQNNISADTGDIDIVYVKASAPIQPNPTGTPTATLKKLGIEGTVFELEGGGGGSSLPFIFDSTERVVGSWFGKPLYSRAWDFGSDIQVPFNTFINTTIDAVDKQAIINAFGVYSTGETCYPLVGNINNGIVRLQACRDNQVALVQYVALKYTKITD